MERVFLVTMILFTLFSCQSQERVDLLSVDFGQKISVQSGMRKDKDAIKGVLCYSTDELNEFAIAGVDLHTYQYPNGNAADYSSLNVYIDDYEKNDYLGFRYNTVNQDEIKLLVKELTTKFKGQYELLKQGAHQGYFFDLKDLNAWLFITDGFSNDKDGKEFLTTDFLYVKKGLRIENSSDPKYNTFLQDFEMSFPR